MSADAALNPVQFHPANTPVERAKICPTRAHHDYQPFRTGMVTGYHCSRCGDRQVD